MRMQARRAVFVLTTYTLRLAKLLQIIGTHKENNHFLLQHAKGLTNNAMRLHKIQANAQTCKHNAKEERTSKNTLPYH